MAACLVDISHCAQPGWLPILEDVKKEKEVLVNVHVNVRVGALVALVRCLKARAFAMMSGGDETMKLVLDFSCKFNGR